MPPRFPSSERSGEGPLSLAGPAVPFAESRHLHPGAQGRKACGGRAERPAVGSREVIRRTKLRVWLRVLPRCAWSRAAASSAHASLPASPPSHPGRLRGGVHLLQRPPEHASPPAHPGVVPLGRPRDLVDGGRRQRGRRTPASAVLRRRAHHHPTRQRGPDPVNRAPVPPPRRSPVMSQTVLFIHGGWVTPACWDRFVSYFEARGHRCPAPAWPGKDRSVGANAADT